MSSLTFQQLREANTSRVVKWHPIPERPEWWQWWNFAKWLRFRKQLQQQWTSADWSNALCGEAGELANVIKKIRRYETGVVGSKDPSYEILRSMASDELGDVQCYLDLLAHHLDIDLGFATARKFNEVSVREGFTERLRTR